MIFSHLFKAKWQNKDSNVRLTAVNDDLSPETPEQLTILNRLIAEDDNELVRRAALLKINTFDTWLTAKNNNSLSKIRDYAHQQIIDMLHGKHAINLSEKQKQLFLDEAQYKSLLEPWLQVENDANTIINLFEKIAKPQLLVNLYNQKQNETVQTYLIEQTEDLLTLEKLLKKPSSRLVADKITTKINAIKAALEKPKAVTKSTQLVLSKLLALKDTSAYKIYLEKKDKLDQEWHTLVGDLTCLTEEQRESFINKQLEITQHLSKIFEVKAEAYQQQLIKEQLEQEKQTAKSNIELKLTQFNQTLINSVFENTLIDESQVEQELNAFSKVIKESVLTDKEKSNYLACVSQYLTRLSQLPEIALSVTEATSLISKISQLPLPSSLEEYNEKQTTFDEWKTQWRAIDKKTDGMLPDSLKNAYKEISTTWNKGLAPFAQQQKQLLNQAQKKLADLKRLLAMGKYNACFGIFKGLKQVVGQLSAKQQQRIERDYENVSKQIADLNDWENYIATPRKQELLTKINALVVTPLDNPIEQSNKVKGYRKAWNLLGHADDDVDKLLNDEFNNACEQAFAPCRLFYAEQDKLRKSNLVVRQSLLAEAKALSESLTVSPIDFKALDSQLNKINHAWKDAGEVDRKVYKALQDQFMAIVQPIKSAIRGYHDENIKLKQGLIDQITAQLENDDIATAVENTKAIQNKWRDIGYAGPRQDNKLWQNFRAKSDELFKKRDEIKNVEKEQQTQQKHAFEQKIALIEGQLNDALDDKALKVLRQDASELHDEVINEKPVIKSVALTLERLIKQVNEQLKANAVAQEQASWAVVFQLLNDIAKNTNAKDEIKNSESFQSLSPSWRKKLEDKVFDNTKTAGQRELKTLELEILAGVDSPKEFSAQRMEVQIKLMQDKMTSGNNSIDLEGCFSEWLTQGQISEVDLPLIERVKPIFYQQ